MGRSLRRMLLVAALAAQGVMAWRATAFDLVYKDGQHAYDRSDYAASLAAFERARAVDDGDPSIWAWQGDAADALERVPPEAGWPAERAAELNRSAWTGYAGAVLRSPVETWSWCGLAETALRRATRLDTDHAVDLGVLERRSRGELDPWRAIALSAAQVAVALKPTGYQELDVLSHVYRSMGRLDEAQDAIVRSARLMPSPSFHSWGAGEALVQPLYEAVMGTMREGIRAAPAFQHSRLHLDVGRFARAQGDLDAALEEFRLAETTSMLADEMYLARRAEADALEQRGRFDDAIKVRDAIIASGVGASIDRRQRGIALRRANRNDEACKDLRESVRDEPHDANLRLFGAATCEAAGDIDTAERMLRDGFSTPTESPAMARALIDFLLRVGKRRTAEGLVEGWVRDFPQHEEFQTWLKDISAPNP